MRSYTALFAGSTEKLYVAHIYSILWYFKGKDYKMASLSSLSSLDSVKIDIEFQCQVGEPVTHEIEYFGIEERTIEDPRRGE